MNNKARIFSFVLCLVFCFTAVWGPAFGISTTSRVEITQNAQVVDSMTFQNVLVEAIYAPKENVSNYNSDTTYCCAALVKRFYSSVYGVTVYNLLSPTSTPLVTSGSFSAVSSPQVGDIVRFTNYTHWAIVKEIDKSGNITLLEQNVWSGNYALVERVIAAEERDSGDYTYFRYSDAVEAHVHAYKKKSAESHPHQYYMGCNGCGDIYHLDEYAVCMDCAQCYDSRYGDLADSTSADPTGSKVKVNGETVEFDAYNINGNNFFKLRDIAYTINDTDKKFSVGWNNSVKSVSMTSGASYKPNGTEMSSPGASTVTADITNAKLYLDKTQIYPLTYSVNNNNYVKLQDLARAMDFQVGYDSGSKTVTINTNESY